MARLLSNAVLFLILPFHVIVAQEPPTCLPPSAGGKNESTEVIYPIVPLDGMTISTLRSGSDSWFQITGTGHRLIMNVTYSFPGDIPTDVIENTVLSIWECVGSALQETPGRYASNDDDQLIIRQDNFAWDSVQDAIYYAYVQIPVNTPVSASLLGVEAFPPPPNQECETAIDFFFSASTILQGTTWGARTSTPLSNRCPFSSSFLGGPLSLPGVWYKARGTGGTWTLSSCESEEKTLITVFESPYISTAMDSSELCLGLSCTLINEDLACACYENTCAIGRGGNTLICSRIPNVITIATHTEKIYYIFVQASDLMGNFIIDMYPNNDECIGALEIAPDMFSKPLLLANFDQKTGQRSRTPSFPQLVDRPCSWLPHSSKQIPDQWHKVQGTGRLMEASTCTVQSSETIDTLLAVLVNPNSDCYYASFSCAIQQNSNILFDSYFDCPLESQVGKRIVWESQAGQTYSIVTFGATPSTGLGFYDLTVSELSPPINDYMHCEKSPDLIVEGKPTFGSLIHASPSNPYSCYNRSSRPSRLGVWYRTTGNGNKLQVILCSLDQLKKVPMPHLFISIDGKYADPDTCNPSEWICLSDINHQYGGLSERDEYGVCSEESSDAIAFKWDSVKEEVVYILVVSDEEVNFEIMVIDEVEQEMAMIPSDGTTSSDGSSTLRRPVSFFVHLFSNFVVVTIAWVVLFS